MRIILYTPLLLIPGSSCCSKFPRFREIQGIPAAFPKKRAFTKKTRFHLTINALQSAFHAKSLAVGYRIIGQSLADAYLATAPL